MMLDKTSESHSRLLWLSDVCYFTPIRPRCLRLIVRCLRSCTHSQVGEVLVSSYQSSLNLDDLQQDKWRDKYQKAISTDVISLSN